MWLVSDAPEDPEDDTVMERHSTKGLYSTVKSLILAIRTKDEQAQQDAAHRMIRFQNHEQSGRGQNRN
jgi:hypothetical protein